MSHITFYHWHWHKKNQSPQFGNPFFGTLARPFHIQLWLRLCAVNIGASYFDNLFSTCPLVLGHAAICGIRWGWSDWSIAIQHVRAQWGSVVPWWACSTGSEKPVRVSHDVWSPLLALSVFNGTTARWGQGQLLGVSEACGCDYLQTWFTNPVICPLRTINWG